MDVKYPDISGILSRKEGGPERGAPHRRREDRMAGVGSRGIAAVRGTGRGAPCGSGGRSGQVEMIGKHS